MTSLQQLLAFLGTSLGLSLAVFRRYYMPKTSVVTKTTPMTQNAPTQVPLDPDSIVYAWDTPAHCYHNVGVLCDKAGLALKDKNTIRECIYQESEFKNYKADGSPILFQNKDPQTGAVWSTDWGICQINDHYHIGVGKDFPTVAYVLQNPDKMAEYMIEMFKAGKLSLWSSYATGAYKKWDVPTSPMWAFATGV